MSFAAKYDFYKLTNKGLVITECNENKSAQTVQAYNEKGDFVAAEIFDETMSPDCSYVLSADTNLSAIQCGTAITGSEDYAAKKFTIGSLTINTAAGQPPTVQASGEEVPAGTTHNDCKYTIPSASLKLCHHSQILWNAFTLSGTGCYLQQANYSAGGNISRATKNGETVAYDITDGQLEVTITITQTGDVKPTVTAGAGWKITAPLNCSNPDADYPSWTCTLWKALEHDA